MHTFVFIYTPRCSHKSFASFKMEKGGKKHEPWVNHTRSTDWLSRPLFRHVSFLFPPSLSLFYSIWRGQGSLFSVYSPRTLHSCLTWGSDQKKQLSFRTSETPYYNKAHRGKLQEWKTHISSLFLWGRLRRNLFTHKSIHQEHSLWFLDKLNMGLQDERKHCNHQIIYQ